MATHIALIRAVNVGGTGKLAMEDLRAICAGWVCRRINLFPERNVVFRAESSEREVAERLDAALAGKLGKARA